MNPSGIFLDLTKAYDVLNHKVLLSKLNSYGIRGVANLWFESYLSHRKQCAEINSIKQEHMSRLQGKLRMVCHTVRFFVQYYFYCT
jgi:hypothetical protein